MDANIGDPRLAPSVERVFEGQSPQTGPVTLRGMVVAAVLGVVFCFITLRIHMTAGIVPTFNMPSAVLSFFFLKCLASLTKSCGISALPFTRQENVFVMSAINASVNVALVGGFATCTIGMSSNVAKTLVDHPDQRDIIDNVDIGKYMMFLLLIGLPAVLGIVPFLQILLIDYRLLFPTGTVAALLVNSFHTPEGAYVAKLQVASLLKAFFSSFCWSAFQWFYTAGNGCGFDSFPTFGFSLYKDRFFFNFSAMYIGLGMICPHIVNITMFFGATISWVFLFPYFDSKQGDWYTEKSPTSISGSNGYKVFLGITVIITDGIFNFFTIISTSMFDFYNKRMEEDSGSVHYISKHPSLTYDDRKRIEKFMLNKIPHLIPVIGYTLCVTISSIVIPSIFHQIKFYHVAALYIFAPVFSFCNSYGIGLTDWSAAPTYAKFTIFVIAASIGHPGAVVASLVACGIMNAASQISANVMQDFKTGYLTLTSPQVMLTGQIYGIILGAIINPCIYYAFKETVRGKQPIGSLKSEFPCPYAGVYRAIGIIGMGGVKELPKHCVSFCTVAFFITLAMNSFKLVSQKKGWTIMNYLPSMTALALPFFTGPYVAIPMCIGSVVVYVWNKVDGQSAEVLSSAVAAGLTCGEGLFTLPTALLTMKKVRPPICMKFLPSGKELGEVDSFLSSFASANS